MYVYMKLTTINQDNEHTHHPRKLPCALLESLPTPLCLSSQS